MSAGCMCVCPIVVVAAVLTWLFICCMRCGKAQVAPFVIAACVQLAITGTAWGCSHLRGRAGALEAPSFTLALLTTCLLEHVIGIVWLCAVELACWWLVGCGHYFAQHATLSAFQYISSCGKRKDICCPSLSPLPGDPPFFAIEMVLDAIFLHLSTPLWFDQGQGAALAPNTP